MTAFLQETVTKKHLIHEIEIEIEIEMLLLTFAVGLLKVSGTMQTKQFCVIFST